LLRVRWTKRSLCFSWWARRAPSETHVSVSSCGDNQTCMPFRVRRRTHRSGRHRPTDALSRRCIVLGTERPRSFVLGHIGQGHIVLATCTVYSTYIWVCLTFSCVINHLSPPPPPPPPLPPFGQGKPGNKSGSYLSIWIRSVPECTRDSRNAGGF
jgi:hypothetical protein